MEDRSDGGEGRTTGATAYPAGDPKLLIDEPLVADTNADAELGGPPVRADRPSDDEIAGSRFTLAVRGVDRIGDDPDDGLVVALDAAFQPAPGARMPHAQVELSLVMPPGASLADVAPREVRHAEPVTFALVRGARLGLETRGVTAGAGREATLETSRYPCHVVGTGLGLRRARWTFSEHDAARDGIGSHHRLVLLLGGRGPFELEGMVSCSLVRAGLAGVPGRVRELILGPHLRDGRASGFTIDGAEWPAALADDPTAMRWYERASGPEEARVDGST